MGITCTFDQGQQNLLELKTNYFSSQSQILFKTLPIGRNNMCNKSKLFGKDRRREAWEACSKQVLEALLKHWHCLGITLWSGQ